VTESSVGRVYFPPAIGHKVGVREGCLIEAGRVVGDVGVV